MMDLFCKRDPTISIAVFAERMLPDIRIPDTLPCSTVLFLVAGPLISVVEMFFLLLMLGAILFTGLSKVGTPCHTAGSSWAIWHQSLPRFFIKEVAPRFPSRRSLFFVSSLHDSRFWILIPSHSSHFAEEQQFLLMPYHASGTFLGSFMADRVGFDLRCGGGLCRGENVPPARFLTPLPFESPPSISKGKAPQTGCFSFWRTGWDSNPRASCETT